MNDPAAAVAPEFLEYARALFAFQQEAPKFREDGVNDSYDGYRYVTLELATETIVPILHKHGLMFTTTTDITEGGRQFIIGRLTHVETGHTEQSRLFLGGTKMQDVGGALTYARRYLLLTMTGCVADKDDDQGNGKANRLDATPAVVHPARNTPMATDQQVADIEGHISQDSNRATRILRGMRLPRPINDPSELTQREAEELLRRLNQPDQ